MPLQIFEAVVVDPAPEGAQPGHITVYCPEIGGDSELPITVAPLFPGWTAGGWHSIPRAVQPETDAESGTTDDKVIVTIIAVTEYDLRWIGTPQYWSEIADNAATRCGARSHKGWHKIIMDDDVGVQIVVSDSEDTSGAKNYLSVGADNVVILANKYGSTLYLDDGLVSLVNSVGDTFVMDDENGISIVHHAGGDLLAIEEGLVKLMGADVQLIGGSVTVTGQGGIVLTDDLAGLSPTEKLGMMETLLTDLASAITELAAAPTALGLPTTNALGMVANIATSLGAGAPYLSTVVENA